MSARREKRRMDVWRKRWVSGREGETWRTATPPELGRGEPEGEESGMGVSQPIFEVRTWRERRLVVRVAAKARFG